ncbi:MAG: sugar phosphate nucleotidyltransferase [Candidatus Woesearchaeota archaeon]
MQAVILAAGKSTRTYPLTLTRPKPLLPVLNKPILQHNLEALSGLINEAIIVVGWKKEMIIERFGKKFGKIRIKYIEQEEAQGTAHAVLQAEKHIKGDRFIVVYGDDLYSGKDILRLMKHKNAALVKEVSNPERFGIYKAKGRIATKLVEKPKEHIGNLANTGCYIFQKKLFTLLKSVKMHPERKEYELTDAVAMLIQKRQFYLEKVLDYWLSIGYPWNLLEANEFLLQRIKEPCIAGEVMQGVHIYGILILGKGSVIRPGVFIEGTVIIGENCRIGPNCYLRDDTVIGNNCHIGQAVEIKNSVIMDHTKINHLSYVGDSVIGEHCNFGAGTITANLRHDNENIMTPVNNSMINTGRRKLGAIIGDHVHTGINTSIYPGRKIWPGVGTRPGEAVDKDKKE